MLRQFNSEAAIREIKKGTSSIPNQLDLSMVMERKGENLFSQSNFKSNLLI